MYTFCVKHGSVKKECGSTSLTARQTNKAHLIDQEVNQSENEITKKGTLEEETERIPVSRS